MTKRGWNSDNVRSRSSSRERVSLLGNRSSTPNKNGLRGRATYPQDQEMVSLLGGPSPGIQKRRGRSRNGLLGRRRRTTKFRDSWTPTRMMKYAALLIFSAGLSYKMLRKESKIIHWEEYNNIVDPKVTKGRCFEEDPKAKKDKNKRAEKCECPVSVKPLEIFDGKWKSNHEHMLHLAKNAPSNLDIVFFGDGIVEQLSGTRDLGGEMVNGMEEYFEKAFTKKKGGKFNAIALGSSGDTGPNLLWHWENGIKQAKLKPKLWYIVVGGNDLYKYRCDDSFVMANVLNVAKKIFEDNPESKIVVHGMFPQKDDLESEKNDLGHLWNRAQGINLDVRKFIKKHSSRIYYMNLGTTLMHTGGMKGRKKLDPNLIDGMYPTSKGMQKWGDLLIKKVLPILKGFDREKHMKQKRPEMEGTDVDR